ncbi:MAG TPA: DUF2267 domain-containing protein [Polyangiaceae bacterium]|nr:DUF2267 domain-containing protein [Polyangiaceae bacterium]
MIHRSELLEHVREGGDFAAGHAEAAVTATLDALGAALLQSEKRTFAEALSSDLASIVLSAHAPKAPLDLDGFYRRVQRHEAVRPGRAREHAQIVCRALAELLPAERVALLTKHVPWLEPLLEVDEIAPSPPAPDVLRRPSPTNTLAVGKPGSQTPLSAGVPDRAQSGSIAASNDPHGDTKLSSSRGTTQERENETLATGHPGSKRPLSG